MPYPAQLLTALDNFEGRVAWPYLDSRGNVTVGCGREIQTIEDFARLPWIVPGAAGLQGQWISICGSRPGQLPHFYEDVTAIRLADEAIDELKIAKLDEASIVYDQRLSGWRTFPVGPVCALLDMGYNMGPDKFWEEPPHGFPHLLAAIAARDWSSAAGNCEREGVQAARNAWTKAQFESAIPA